MINVCRATEFVFSLELQYNMLNRVVEWIFHEILK